MSGESLPGRRLPGRLRTSLDDFVAHVRDERGSSPHTVRAYRGDVADLLEFCAMRGVDDVSAIELIHLRGWLALQARQRQGSLDDRQAGGVGSGVHGLECAAWPGPA